MLDLWERNILSKRELSYDQLYHNMFNPRTNTTITANILTFQIRTLSEDRGNYRRSAHGSLLMNLCPGERREIWGAAVCASYM